MKKVFIILATLELVLSREYYLIKQSKNFKDANEYCQKTFGSKLASLGNKKDQKDLKKLVGTNSVLIGLQQTKAGAGTSKDDFTYIDGSGSTFKPFGPGEPNNAGNEDCVEFRGSLNNLNDLNCATKRYFVCNSVNVDPRKYYYVPKKKVTYSEANSYCKRVYGTQLATFRNAVDFLAFQTKVKGNTWVGLKQKKAGPGKKKSDFAYIDGTKTDYKPFGPGEPNNSGGEDCVEYRNGKKDLNDLKCSDKREIVCNAATYALPKKYIYVDKSANFEDANKYCKHFYGTTLATFGNGADYKSFEAVLKGQSSWVGLKQNKPGPGKKASDFAYIDGSKSVYRPFGPGEPNNAGGEDCVEYRTDQKELNDLNCKNSRKIVCNFPEKPLRKPRKYIKTGKSMPFEQANTYCQNKYKTTLATLRNGGDYVAFQKKTGGKSTWVGLKQKASTGAGTSPKDFVYIDGTKSNYKPFGQGEPNNAGDEDCVEFRSDLKVLNDLKCSSNRNVVCNAPKKKKEPCEPKITKFEQYNKKCEKKDSYLIAINNEEDQKLAKKLCKKKNGNKCYIGLTDLPKFTEDSDDYWFVDGSIGEYADGWGKNEPKYSNGNSCVYMDKTRGYKWFADSCDLKIPYICAPVDKGNSAKTININAKHNKNGELEIEYNGWDKIIDIRYVFIGSLVIGALCAVFSVVVAIFLCRKPDDYKPVSYLSDSSDTSDDEV